ncbi:luciferase family oxidoreductase [Alicycliphilus sp. B1]|nr:luciferase family oxidoreductase [Alicycliphilus sp. B1]
MLGIITGQRGLLRPPVENYLPGLPPAERAAIADFLAVGVVGGPQTVRAGLRALAQATRADEFMLVSDVFDPELRLRSLEIAGAGQRRLTRPAATMTP